MKKLLLVIGIFLQLNSSERNNFDSKTIKHANFATFKLYYNVPKEIFKKYQTNLKDLLEKYQIYFDTNFKKERTAQDWEMIYRALSQALNPSLMNDAISIEQVPQFLKDSKAILKSFLPKDNTEQKQVLDHKEKFIPKERYLRLFTYAHLERIIKEKNLTHIKLPKKYLFIFNKKTEKFLSPEESAKIIDEMLKLYIGDYNTVYFGYEWEKYPDYAFLVIAEGKEQSKRQGLNKMAMRELEILCNESPFDIGGDNIFWDSHGDAIIIDTEYKGTSQKDCIKLKRYPVAPTANL